MCKLLSLAFNSNINELNTKIDISLLGVEIQGMLPDDVLRKNTGSKEQIHNLLKQNGYIYTDRVELDSFFLKK